jgi:hypothetical protein
MKRKIFIFTLSLIMIMGLVACIGTQNLSESTLSDSNYISMPENPAPLESDTTDFISVETEEISLRDNVFIGEGRMLSLSGESIGGNEFLWLFTPFGEELVGISVIYIDLVCSDEFEMWRMQFPSAQNLNAPRRRGEANIRTFIDDFGLTFEDFVGAWEEHFGKSMEEMESIILWAREVIERGGDLYEEDENCNMVGTWDLIPTANEIAVLFSDDVYEIWEAFPGQGIIYNGRVYSPAWIFENLEQALIMEALPLEDIIRVIDKASEFSELAEEVRIAQDTIHTVLELR